MLRCHDRTDWRKRKRDATRLNRPAKFQYRTKEFVSRATLAAHKKRRTLRPHAETYPTLKSRHCLLKLDNPLLRVSFPRQMSRCAMNFRQAVFSSSFLHFSLYSSQNRTYEQITRVVFNLRKFLDSYRSISKSRARYRKRKHRGKI